VLVILVAMWLYYSLNSYAGLSVAVTLVGAVAQPRIPWQATSVLAAISWAVCFGGFALYASAGFILAYNALVALSVPGMTNAVHCTMYAQLLFALVVVVCSTVNMTERLM
jgi:hypothetical protein